MQRGGANHLRKNEKNATEYRHTVVPSGFTFQEARLAVPEARPFEPRLSEPRAAIVIPLDNSIIFVRLLNSAEFPGRFSELAQTRDAVPRIQFLISCGWLGERRPLGAIRVRLGANV
jgi:hypothetical protein